MTEADEFKKLLQMVNKEKRRDLIQRVYNGVKDMIIEEIGDCDENVLINVLSKTYGITEMDILILKSYSSVN
jgi:hypothetical protein